MPAFERGDVVRVPFPHSDGRTVQHRPGLVVSNGAIGDAGLLLWVAMITSAENRPWPGDVSLGDAYQAAGLPIPSVVRPAKLATIEAARAERVGSLPPGLMRRVDRHIDSLLGR